MRVGILGSGMVGQALGGKIAALGHEVTMGSRDRRRLEGWRGETPGNIALGSFADAAAFGEIVFNCTAGAASLDALSMAGKENLDGKVLVDVSNPLSFSKEMPPTLTVCNTDSLGEQIQRALPRTRVVKALNTVTAPLMVNPAALPEDHAVFLCGNDEEAKAKVTEILTDWFGWRSVIDLGDITGARGMEMYLPLWIRMWGVLQKPLFNIKVVS